MRPVERFSLTCQTWRNDINRKCLICFGVISIKSYILWSLIERFIANSLFLFNRHSSTHCIKGCLVSLKIGDCPLFGNENTCPVIKSKLVFLLLKKYQVYDIWNFTRTSISDYYFSSCGDRSPKHSSCPCVNIQKPLWSTNQNVPPPLSEPMPSS